MDVKSAIVTNEAEFPEFVHEKIDPGARCTNHFRQHLLGNFRKHFLRLGSLAIASEEQKSPSQTFLAGIKKLIDQIFLDSDVPRK